MESTNGTASLHAASPSSGRKTSILLTGPSGRVGPHLVPGMEERYDLRTFDLKANGQPNSFAGDLSSIDDLRIAMRGVEVVVHLAATSDEAPFVEQLVPNNVIGLFNVFEAARLESVKRVVFASSVQAFGIAMDRSPVPIETDIIRPNSLYGATKAFGEIMGQWYHDRFNVEFVAIRLGWFQDYADRREIGGVSNIWLSPRDLLSIVEKAIDVPGLKCVVVNATSIVPEPKMSLVSAREILGFEPMDDVVEFSNVAT